MFERLKNAILGIPHGGVVRGPTVRDNEVVASEKPASEGTRVMTNDIPLEQVAQRAEELYPELKDARMPIIERARPSCRRSHGLRLRQSRRPDC